MFDKEFIVETEDGKLFHVTESHPLFRKGHLYCKEIRGNIGDLGPDYLQIQVLRPKGTRITDTMIVSSEYLKPGAKFTTWDKGRKEGKDYTILKVFQRIH